ncbi:EscU/YscU/HrcU family type III secretion system export apparatus switch protein [Phyllobacterium leguminum]|uniref:Flagellar biosynthetic protein FlhB n=1 Tax=Phyllobacterium leguminum TaxID=314237 RepID=A0A318TGF6_9HYPH|nr:EscU/YscU/HrcU family type III secretion system export apparatus switch protein [Phyllobacterium leguminum]PYE87721.1 flagellar biosynthetic protein FlhB [Phyllobacterium leguminum]
MSDAPDKESKTEEASEQKVRDAVEKGNLPFAKEVPILASVVAFLIIAVFISAPGAAKLTFFLAELIDRPEDWLLNSSEDAGQLFQLLAIAVGTALLPILVIVPLAGIAASAFQNAPRFVGERIRPQFSRISPAKGWTRIFGKAGQVEFLKSLFKLSAASLVVFFVFFNSKALFTDAIATDPRALPEFIRLNVVHLLAANAVAITVLAGFDIAWSRIHWRGELRMTKQEVKDEHKQSEGNPLVKSRQRSLGRDRARRRMIAAVPTATLIVANPTHFAVALRYRPAEDSAPVVVAKGQDLIALKIREIAEANGIPVFEDVQLARSLHKQMRVDQIIAPEFYKAVAELIQFINSRQKPYAVSA